MRFSKKFFAAVIASAATVSAIAASGFVIGAIQINGLQGIPASTVLKYMPVKVGDTLTPDASAAIIQNLYGSGLFQNVSLAQSGNTLVVNVAEGEVIGLIKITGNDKIKTADIQKALKTMGIKSGSMLNHQKLDAFQAALQSEYVSMGRYNTSVQMNTSPQGPNRVQLNIVINEGNIAKISSITITGNQAYSEKTLIKQLVLTTPKLWSFITQNDRYSKPKMDASLKALENFYLNHGYLRAQIVNAQANLTPDKRSVAIVIQVSEGPKYFFSGFQLNGNLILPEATLASLVTVKEGNAFSKQVVISSMNAIGTALGDQGYSFAQIQPIPQVDEQNHTVNINFFVTPGPKVYVRRIVFTGNSITSDDVLRHNVMQEEGSLISVSNVRNSVHQLQMLGFFKNVTVKTVPVPGTNNQVDLVFDVTETPAGQASLNLGYGTLGFQYGAGINQTNFLGTGRTVGFNFTRSEYLTSYSFNYYNPYYTVDNIGRGFSLTYQHTDPDALNLASYTYDTVGGQFYYSIPLSMRDHLQVGAGFYNIALGLGTPTSTEITQFVNEYGKNFNQVLLTAAWNHVGQNYAIFPTEGFDQSLTGNYSIPASSGTLKYYTAAYSAQLYVPLSKSQKYVFNLNAGAAYGNGYGGQDGLPFFENFYAGGLSQGMVRGFDENTLGPKDSLGNSIGGNELVYGTADVIFPNYISDSLRTSIFTDAGNVYQSNAGLYTTGSGPIRYSGGVGVQWQSPFGLLSFSYAVPLNKQPGDDLEPFQFTMGTSF